MSRVIRRRARRALVASAAAVVLAGGAVGGAAGPAAADEGDPVRTGSLLIAESFAGASVDDPLLHALGAACLTAATPGEGPPAGASGLGP